MGCVWGWGGFLCEYFSVEKPQDGLCVKIVGMEHEKKNCLSENWM